jgi:hypothetical protein
MTVIHLPDGGFAVADSNGNLIAWPFEDHSDAWRWIDRHEGQHINPSEQKSDLKYRDFHGRRTWIV